jgi:hypothetical protein
MTARDVAPLVGYRQCVDEFHVGPWLARELVSFRGDRRVPVFHDVPPPESTTTRRLVSERYALVSFVDIDWIDRRARLEVRVLDDELTPQLDDVLSDAIRIAVDYFRLLRLEGEVTPVHYNVAPTLRSHGFELEAVVPHGIRVDGKPVARQLWGMVIAP